MGKQGGMSKSQFIRGRQCHKSLWLHRNRPAVRDEISKTQQAVFDSGTDVGVLAQRLFPGGLLIPFEGLSFDQQVQQTRQALAEGVSTIYEATFIHENVFVKVDILHRGPEGWELYEVKSSTGCKQVYLDDIGLQHYVVTGAGVPLVRDFLVHINTQYVRRGEIEVQQLFACLEVTDLAHGRQDEVTAELNLQKTMVVGDEPVIDIGPHCDDPYACDFKGYCWQHIPKPSVFSLRDRGKPDAFALYRQGIVRLEEVPLRELGWRQQLQVNGLLHQRDHIDQPAVRKFLQWLWYPLCFLDFETTYLTPVPLFDGTSPYQQIPFQFSLHILDQLDGKVSHRAFLAEPQGDPQEDFIRSLVESLPENACILTYNQTFEIRILRELADRLPHWRLAVNTIIANLRDLMTPFAQKKIYFGSMNGSYSIKKVLPALVSDLDYANLSINDGALAASAYLQMRQSTDPDEVETLRQGLLEYCHLDTWGMVRIVDRMREMV